MGKTGCKAHRLTTQGGTQVPKNKVRKTAMVARIITTADSEEILGVSIQEEDKTKTKSRFKVLSKNSKGGTNGSVCITQCGPYTSRDTKYKHQVEAIFH
jgi:hypothetical protein